MSAKSGASSSNAEYTKHMMKEQVREQMKELTIILKAVSRKANVSDSMILGISSLLFESIRGVGGQSRNHGMEIFNQLLDIVIGEKTLGRGKYGTVYLGTVRGSPERVALKRINKANMTPQDAKNVMVVFPRFCDA